VERIAMQFALNLVARIAMQFYQRFLVLQLGGLMNDRLVV